MLSCNSLPTRYLKFWPFLTSSSERTQSSFNGSPRNNDEILINAKVAGDEFPRGILYAMPADDYKWFKPKSLQITFEPTFNDTKLKIEDTFLDGINAQTLENVKRNPTTKKPKRPQPIIKNKLLVYSNKPQPRPVNKIIPEKKQIEELPEQSTSVPPSSGIASQFHKNNLSGLSQIGNRESQMVIKPTVIVNIRGTVSNTDSAVSVESRVQPKGINIPNDSAKSAYFPRNVYQINQEINLQTDLFSPMNESAVAPSPAVVNKFDYKDDERTVESSRGRSYDNVQVQLDTHQDGFDVASLIDDYLEFDLFK